MPRVDWKEKRIEQTVKLSLNDIQEIFKSLSFEDQIELLTELLYDDKDLFERMKSCLNEA